ncbi:MAG: AAA family ATPase [Bacteroidetes bacterium]|nr:AAA family ATPase [Bacteroidota bacterium]
MKLERASRKQSKIKLSLAGPSGSGKTFSALLLSYGLCNDWNKVALIDTENHSASLYSHIGDFSVINLSAPFHPEKYVEAIQLCEQSGIEVIIIDSITHEWTGKGGCLELHEKEVSKMKIPNSFTAWASITPRHQAFVDAVINSSCHIISTIRSKTDYIISERNGKQVPQKVGLAPITREGFDFEQTIAFDIDQQHKAFCTKDRTTLFQDGEPFVITADTGKKILKWCNEGDFVDINFVLRRINDTKSIKELLDIYREFPQFKEALKPEYEQQKRNLLINGNAKTELVNQPISSNGQH